MSFLSQRSPSQYHVLISTVNAMIQIDCLVIRVIAHVQIMDVASETRAESNSQFGLKISNLNKTVG